MTDEYTPTTAEVRACWGWDDDYEIPSPARNAEFDRWLAQVKAEAWDEGAESRQCHCAAWSEGECGCGNWPSERNPYRAAELRANSTKGEEK